MIKKFCVLFLALTVLFSSCQKETKSLAKPDAIVLEQTSSSFTVAWQAVEGATNYVYTLDGSAEQTTTETIVTVVFDAEAKKISFEGAAVISDTTTIQIDEKINAGSSS